MASDNRAEKIGPENPSDRLVKIFDQLFGLTNGELGRLERSEFHGIGPEGKFRKERITAKPLSTCNPFLYVLASPG